MRKDATRRGKKSSEKKENRTGRRPGTNEMFSFLASDYHLSSLFTFCPAESRLFYVVSCRVVSVFPFVILAHDTACCSILYVMCICACVPSSSNVVCRRRYWSSLVIVRHWTWTWTWDDRIIDRWLLLVLLLLSIFYIISITLLGTMKSRRKDGLSSRF